MLRTDWKYYIDAVEVNPSRTDKTQIRYKHDDGEIFFTQEFNGDLTFTKSDYLIFKADYDLNDYCKRYEFIIEQKCNHVYQVTYIGSFSLLDGEFDFDKCTFKVKPTLEDKYSCLKLNEDTTINLLDAAVTKYTLTSDYYTYIEFNHNNALQEMVLLTTMDGLFRYNDDCSHTYSVNIYAREVVVLPERLTPDETWTEWDQVVARNNREVPEGFIKWVRNLDYVTITIAAGDIVITCDSSYDSNQDYSLLSDFIKVVVEGIPPVVYVYRTRAYYKYTFLNSLVFLNAEITYINCIKLVDAINFAKDQCSVGDLQSEFFTNATNPVTGIASKTNNIYLIQKSDAKRPSASEQATKGETTWKELMTAIQNYFNVKWYLDVDSNLKIEHISTILKSTGIDITVNPYLKTTANKKKFKFDKNLIYKFEQWNISEAYYEDFKGLPITYSDNCTKKDGKFDSKNYDTGEYMTDLGYLQNKPDKVSDTGFIIVACDANDKIINETGILSGNTILNGSLAISLLHDNYWRHERIFLTGTMNGVSETFESAIKLKQLDKINIIKCCDVDFDPIETINTDLGTAIVENASFNLFDNKLELDLYV